LLWTAAIRPAIRGWNDTDKRLIPSVPRWLHKTIRREVFDLHAEARASQTTVSALPPSKRQFCAIIEGAIGTIASGHGGYHTTLGCIETRFPYLDRTLVEFLAAIPTSQQCRPTQNRSIQRRSLRTILPDLVFSRSEKRGPAQAVLIGIANKYEFLNALLSDGYVCQCDYADRDGLLHALNEARHGIGSQISELLRIITLEMWLRALDGTAAKLEWPSETPTRCSTAPKMLNQKGGDYHDGKFANA
jgi:hypothetical protein